MSDKKHTLVGGGAGLSMFTYPDGTVIEHDCIQCCHCGRVWAFRPGSGNVRGFCARCSTRGQPAFTCGPDCPALLLGPCVPKEKYLDYLSTGIDPTKSVSVAGGWSPSAGGAVLLPQG